LNLNLRVMKKNKKDNLTENEPINVAPENGPINVEKLPSETLISEDGNDIIFNAEVVPPTPDGNDINLNMKVIPLTPPEKTETNIEKSVFIQKIEEKEVPIIEEKIQLFYKIIFIQDKKEKQYFTKTTPEIKGAVLQLKNAFEKITFSENVLGKRIVTASCKLKLDAVIRLDLVRGLLIKIGPIENWMNLTKTNVEKIYNERVLNTYRELASSVIPIINKSEEKKSGLITL